MGCLALAILSSSDDQIDPVLILQGAPRNNLASMDALRAPLSGIPLCVVCWPCDTVK